MTGRLEGNVSIVTGTGTGSRSRTRSREGLNDKNTRQAGGSTVRLRDCEQGGATAMLATDMYAMTDKIAIAGIMVLVVL